MSVIHGHLQNDHLAHAYVSMVETYLDWADDPEGQSVRDKLAQEMAKTLEMMVNNFSRETEDYHDCILKAFELIANTEADTIRPKS